MKGFFLVWSPKTGYAKKRHPTYKAAENEAKRLAVNSNGRHFYVLRALARAAVEPITLQTLS